MNLLRVVSRWLLGLLFIAAGVNHFLQPDFYVRIMPPYLPWHLPLVYVSGIAEAVLGFLLLVPRTKAAAAWGLIALLIAVFPANVHMAMNPELFSEFNPVMLWARLPLQGVLIAWAYWFTNCGPAIRSSKFSETKKSGIGFSRTESEKSVKS